AGLALGFEDLGVEARAIGFAVCDDQAYFHGIVDRLAHEAHLQFGLPALSPGRYAVHDGFVGQGYAKSTPRELAFLANTLRRHGLALDPVYTNKAFMGLLETLRDAPRSLTAGGSPRRVVFVHTGGIFGL